MVKILILCNYNPFIVHLFACIHLHGGSNHSCEAMLDTYVLVYSLFASWVEPIKPTPDHAIRLFDAAAADISCVPYVPCLLALFSWNYFALSKETEGEIG